MPAASADDRRPENLLIEEAIAVCRRASKHDREESGAEADFSAKRDFEITALQAWAEANDLWVPHLVPDQIDDSQTREHLIIPQSHDPTRIYKSTKGPGWGIFPASLATTRHKPVRYWFEDRPGTPSEYLKRLLLSNTCLMHDLDREMYPELNRLEGFVISHGCLQAVTSQPIFIGTPASPSEMAEWFLERGFIFIRSWTWFRPEDCLAVFDAWIDNVMVCDHGLVPFDVIPIIAKGRLLDSLLAALTRLKLET